MTRAELQRKYDAATAAAKGVLATAEAQGRDITPAEQAKHDAWLTEAKKLKAQYERAGADDDIREQIEALTGGNTRTARRGGGGQSLGAQFVASDLMDWIKDSRNSRSGLFTSPSVELVETGLQAATLTEDAASGGDLVVPDYQPTIQRLPTRPLRVAGLFSAGPTDSNLITYMKETTFTNAAAPVAEAGTKPESTLIFAAVSDPVQKIAHWLPVTEEVLQDVPSIRAYIDARLRDGVDLTEDDQLLNGSGTPPAIRGILNRTGLAAAVARGTDSNADAIYRQIAAITTATSVPPDGIVLHPNAWLNMQLLKNANGDYINGTGPFAATARPTLWGLPVALTTTITSTVALVGAFRARAQLFRHGGLRVEISNSHANFFVENKIAIRAERREALAVYQPAAFGTVTGLLTS